MGDVVRIGDDEFRFHADEATFEPDADLLAGSGARAVMPEPAAGGTLQVAEAESPAIPSTVERSKGSEPPLLATLEILNQGVHKGARFRIHRAITHVGRRGENDVRLDDDSVSGSHAVLVRRGDGWTVTDLESTNGTYVDGERIQGERALAAACELRFGGMKALFRAIAASSTDSSSTRVIVGAQDPGAGSDS
jgi:pSer/pThr/pTyr-binding forkhead associated (FHA) protein